MEKAIVSQYVIQSDSMSLKAKGVYAALHIMSEVEVMQAAKEGSETILNAINELEKAGHITRTKCKQRGYVYIITDTYGNYKIGKTGNPLSRLLSLQLGLPYFEIVHYIYCRNMHDREKELHERYKDKKIRNEWFKLTAEDIEYIKTIGNDTEHINQYEITLKYDPEKDYIVNDRRNKGRVFG